MNSFALLNDSDDDEKPQVATQQQKKTTPKETTSAPKKVVPGLAPKPVKATAAPAPTPAVTDDGGGFTKENSRGAGAKAGKDTKQKEEYRKKHTDKDPRQKHENDRRPAAGHARGEQSKSGAGNFGAGNPNQEAREAEKNPDAVIAADAAIASEAATPMENVVEEEPEPATRSLDDFMAIRNAERAKINAPVKVREVSKIEGAAEKQDETWEDTWATKKGPKAEIAAKDQRSAKANAMPIVFKFRPNAMAEEESRGGRGAGGRGGDRGDRPDRGPRPPRAEGDRPPRTDRPPRAEGDRPPRAEGAGGRGAGRGERREGGGRGAGGRGAPAGRGSAPSSGRGGARPAAFSDQDFPSL